MNQLGSLLHPVDIFTPAAPGTLMRCYQLKDSGVFRLSRRDCSFYSIMIAMAGTCGQIVLRTGEQRIIWMQPSSFTGSFVLDGFCEGGLMVEAYMEGWPSVTVNWREPDRMLV